MRLVVAPEMRPEPLHQRCNAEGLQIIVEVFPRRHEQPDCDALRKSPARERKSCVKARAVVIADEVETLEAVWQAQRAKVRGGQRRNTRKVWKNGAHHGRDQALEAAAIERQLAFEDGIIAGDGCLVRGRDGGKGRLGS